MSTDEIDKHIQTLIGDAGIDKAGIENPPGRPRGELLIEVADSSSPTKLAPGDGWAARWSRRCRKLTLRREGAAKRYFATRLARLISALSHDRRC